MNQKRGKKPLISVIMPVYNTKEKYLRAAIESILNQTFRKFEFIIVDDCSTKENTEQVIRSYHDPRIRFVKQDKNQGDAVARNRGIKMARGEFIAMQDSDDISRPKRLEIQLEYMRKYPDVGVLGTAYNVFPLAKEKVWNKFGSPEYLNSYAFFHNSPFGHSSVLIRSSVLKEVGVEYDKNYICNDFKLWMDLVGKTKFMNVPKVLLDYRCHGNNISLQKADVMNDQVAKIRAQAWIDELKMPIQNKSLMIKFFKGEKLSLVDQRKAMNVIYTVFSIYQKKEANLRTFQMLDFLINGIKERAQNNGNKYDDRILNLKALFLPHNPQYRGIKEILKRKLNLSKQRIKS